METPNKHNIDSQCTLCSMNCKIVHRFYFFFSFRVYSLGLRFVSPFLLAVAVTRPGWLNGSQQTVDLSVAFVCYKPTITDTTLAKHLPAILLNPRESVSIIIFTASVGIISFDRCFKIFLHSTPLMRIM